MFPVDDPVLWQTIMDVVAIQLADTDRARLMLPDGQYIRVDRRGKPHLDSQQALCRQAVDAAQKQQNMPSDFRFEPADGSKA